MKTEQEKKNNSNNNDDDDDYNNTIGEANSSSMHKQKHQTGNG